MSFAVGERASEREHRLRESERENEQTEKKGERAARRLRDARAPEPPALSQPGRTCAGGRRGAPLPWGKGPDGRREPRAGGAEGGRTGGGLEREPPALRFPGWAGARKEPRAAGVLGFPPGPCTRAHTTRLHSLGLRNGGSRVSPAQLRPGDAAGLLRPPPSSLSARAHPSVRPGKLLREAVAGERAGSEIASPCLVPVLSLGATRRRRSFSLFFIISF